jgi:hypothetical protein
MSIRSWLRPVETSELGVMGDSIQEIVSGNGAPKKTSGNRQGGGLANIYLRRREDGLRVLCLT